jgi:hypothetical protein
MADWVMANESKKRVFEWAIEDIFPAHPHLYLEHCAAMAVAVMSRGSAGTSASPCGLMVECQGLHPTALAGDTSFFLRVSWTEETAASAGRILWTEQRTPIVERAAVALAALLFAKLIPDGEMRVTRRGEHADYWLPTLRAALEISGTEQPRELGRRYREKVAQVLSNPVAWPGYALVCCFGTAPPLVRWSYHEPKAGSHATT